MPRSRLRSWPITAAASRSWPATSPTVMHNAPSHTMNASYQSPPTNASCAAVEDHVGDVGRPVQRQLHPAAAVQDRDVDDAPIALDVATGGIGHVVALRGHHV